ncbi:MFS transporter [uncultured Clostridium sp.]|uniref:MFS transporter n=1 Tax=uncultured Clostridium sp. TaxID=59620 RepID=UPI00262C5002|nr:MFS transporter [uncultured Clostridium sp.]
MDKKKIFMPLLMAIPSFGLGFIWNMKSTLLSLLVRTVTPSDIKLGIVAALCSFTGVFFPYIGGVLSEKKYFKIGRRKPWTLVGGILGSIFILLLGFADSYITIVLCVFIAWSSFNFFQGAYYAWMPESVEANQVGTVNGLGKLFYSFGGLLFYFFAVFLFNIDKHLPFILIAILALIPILITCYKVKEQDIPVSTTKFKLNLEFLKNKPAMKVFLTGSCFYFAYGIITPFWIPYYETTDHFTGTEISLALASLTLVGMILSIFIGVWCDKWRKDRIFLICCIVYALAFVIGWNVKSLSMLWLFAVVSGVAFIMFQVAYYSLMPEIAPKGRVGEYMGLNNVFICIPQIISSLIGGVLLDYNLGFVIFPLAIIAMIIGACVIASYKRKHFN